MAKLTWDLLSKPFTVGPHEGQSRYALIATKIDDGSPFHMVKGNELKILYYNGYVVKKAFEDDDLDKLAKLSAGRVTNDKKPFIDIPLQTPDENGVLKDTVLGSGVTRNYYGIGDLEETREFTEGEREKADPHELMTGALILKYGSSGKKSVPIQGVYKNLKQASVATEELKKEAGNIISTEGDKQKKINAFPNSFQDFAQAISAANAFLDHKNTNDNVVKVYATGRQWDTILSGYRIQDHMLMKKKDYNSSDLIVEVERGGNKGKVFVGISLKKKGIDTADPTVINKTVIGTDGLLQRLADAGALGIRQDFNDVYEKRAQFFYEVIKKGLMSRDSKVVTFCRKKLGLERVPNNSTWEKERAKYLRSVWSNVKPSLSTSKKVLEEAQKLEQGNMNKALFSEWPNVNKEENVRNFYFKKLFDVLSDPKYAKPIVIALVNIIFKTDLGGIMKLRKPKRNDFKFTLITGEGNYRASTAKIDVGEAKMLYEEFTTGMITKMMDDAGEKGYYVRTTQGKAKSQAWNLKSKASKIFFTVWIGKINLADLEIRYKGAIRNEPQFFATITPKFKLEYNKWKKNHGKMYGGSDARVPNW